MSLITTTQASHRSVQGIATGYVPDQRPADRGHGNATGVAHGRPRAGRDPEEPGSARIAGEAGIPEDNDAAHLYALFAPHIRARLIGRGLQPADADDAVQEVFRRYLQNLALERLAPPNVEGWLFTTARHVAASSFRRRTTTNEDAVLAEIPAAPLGCLEAAEGAAAVADAVRVLPASQRAVVALRFGRGLTNRRAAELLGISENAAALRLFRAVAAIRRCMQRGGR